MCVLGEERVKKLTLTTQLVDHHIKVDRKIDPAHANENMHIHTYTVHMALS